MFEQEGKYGLLALQGEFFSDIEKVRIANANRKRSMEEVLGVVEGPEIERADVMNKMIDVAEKEVEKDLLASFKEISPTVLEWVDDTHGIGRPSMARLIAVIGHPCWRYDRESEIYVPRTLGQLRSYCGYAPVDGRGKRKEKGKQIDWNPEAKKRAYIIVATILRSATRARSPYYDLFLEAKEHYKGSVHEYECQNRSRYNPDGCGTREHPEWGAIGSPLRPAHIEARARRKVIKAMLKDLWQMAYTELDPEIQKQIALEFV